MASEKVIPKRATATAKACDFVVHGKDAREVVVTGDFTGWSEEGIPLTKTGNGDWKTVLKFLPGEYQYRIRVDGNWQDHAEAKKRVQNPFGTENCILTIS